MEDINLVVIIEDGNKVVRCDAFTVRTRKVRIVRSDGMGVLIETLHNPEPSTIRTS